MVAAKIKMETRESLSGKWGKSALMMLSYLAIEFLVSAFMGLFSRMPFISFLFYIAFVVFSVPLMYGLIVSFLKLKRGKNVNYTDFISTAFSNIVSVWKVFAHIFLKMLPLFVLVLVLLVLSPFVFISSWKAFSILIFFAYFACVICLVPKSLLYSLSFFILYDHPEMTPKETVEKSETLMKGHRWNLVWLYITFIGWAILSVFTLGIGFLFLIPYIFISFIVFYEELDKTSPSQQNKNFATEISSVSQDNEDPTQQL